MWKKMRKWLYRIVPEHIDNPFSLAMRMVTSRKRAAIFTLFVSGLSVLMVPVDMILARKEHRRLRKEASGERYPKIFVIGPARSGTTLAFQVLSTYLDVSFLQNFTAVFPRSPITTTSYSRRLFGKPRIQANFANYYGKTSGFSAPSEANHIWNRWVQPDGSGFRTIVNDEAASDAGRFFGVFSEIDEKALIVKNNNFNAFADVIDKNIENCWFICLRRDQRFLSQSLLQARREIRGNVSRGYGVQDDSSGVSESSPIEDVCRQVKYLDELAEKMREEIGAERFWIVDYESFCAEPGQLLQRIVESIGVSLRDPSAKSPEPFQTTNKIRDPEEMAEIERTFARLCDE
jgi:hypothetical protein